MKRLEKRLQKQEEKGLLRNLSLFPTLGVDFASNDYLGFARSEELKKEMLLQWASLSQLGATGSRLLTGHTKLCAQVEKEIAKFHGKETATLFSSGYAANVGVITAIAGREDTIFFDQNVHASCRDGISLSRAKHYPWRHNDLNHLEEHLRKTPHSIVLAESVYSTDGSRAPQELYSLCEKYESTLLIDEAHALGIFPQSPAHIHLYTFGKALGISGAAVLGSSLLKKALLNFSRPFIYTTALPDYSLVAIQCAYQQLKKESATVEKLHSLLREVGLKTQIWGLPTLQAKAKAKMLLEEGFHVNSLLPPTVAKEALRIVLHAFNTKEEFERVCLLLS